MSNPTPPGKFCWYELTTSDVEAAKAFYTKAIGWSTAPFEGEMPYEMWINQEAPVGGVMTLSEEARQAHVPPHWMAYISTPSVDDTATQATQLGGQVLVPPRDIPNVGRFAVIADPQGASFAAFTPATPGEDSVFDPKVGEFSWHELATTDHTAAFNFYSALFGWEKAEGMDMGEMGTYQLYGRGDGKHLGGMFNKLPDMPGPPAWLYYISIDDVRVGVDRVKDLGGRLLNGPMEVPGGDLIAQCLDPQGAFFALHSRPPQ